jgi:UDP-glucuronate 4-epimerase
MRVLVTGAAGFIGAHVCRSLLQCGKKVFGIDNLNDYYSVQLKHHRLAWAAQDAPEGAFKFAACDFGYTAQLDELTKHESFDAIVHLGAQAGVRYSIENPLAYAHSNLLGHLNMLELARNRRVSHMVYASSSSVYGVNKALPFRVEDRVDFPISLYAATKKADELMSETYAHLYRVPLTGLRFFTVYGPWGRPDMAVWLFTDAILNGRPIKLFNNGEMKRDFTYIDDIVAGVVGCLDRPPVDDNQAKAGGSVAPHTLYNIGNNGVEELGALIVAIETACGRTAIKEMLPMQAGDVPATYADISAIERDIGFRPTTPISEGIPRFVEWFRAYKGI